MLPIPGSWAADNGMKKPVFLRTQTMGFTDCVIFIYSHDLPAQNPHGRDMGVPPFLSLSLFPRDGNLVLRQWLVHPRYLAVAISFFGSSSSTHGIWPRKATNQRPPARTVQRCIECMGNESPNQIHGFKILRDKQRRLHEIIFFPRFGGR